MHKNYTLISEKNLGHMDAAGYLYRHTSGAQVLYIKSDDDNKVFSATFKTPPADETGVAHIMEHCVLNGSQKYPLKDPFNQLASGSLYTFLNAMTYPDRTVYPVASVNDADFLILMDIYLDAVFFPKIYDRKETLKQEGWHYQLEDKNDDLKYNGIVYNEMKGAYSDPQGLISDALNIALFPDSLYSLDSGGNPDAIPNLDYAAFIDFHKKYYRPENALIYFYGNMDIDYCFKKLDAEYLSKFEKTGNVVEITPQRPLGAPIFTTGRYSVADEEGLEENYMAMAAVLPEGMQPKDITGMKLLYYVLMSTPASPLYKALVEAEIGEDIGGYFSTDLLHPSIRISMRNSTVAVEEFKDLIDRTLNQIVKDGLDKDFVAACLNYIEFQAREEDYGYWPKGLVYHDRAMTFWLYGSSPFDGLFGLEHLVQIRKLCEGSKYLEELITKYLLENTHQGYAALLPILDLDGQKEAEIAEKLAKTKATMDDNDINQILTDYQTLKTYQETPDTPEVLALIPRVALADIKKEIEITPLNITNDGLSLLHSPLATNDIIYTTLMFDIQSVNPAQFPLVKILQYILGKIATKTHDTAALTQKMKANLGGLSFSTDIVSKTQQDYMARAVVSGKFLSKNARDMFEITADIVKNSVFTDKSQIKSYITELKASMEDMFLTSGSLFAVERAGSYFSPAAAANGLLGGLPFYEYVKDLAENFDAPGRFEQLGHELTHLMQQIYNKNGVQYGIVADENLMANCRGYLTDFHNTLHEASASKIIPPPLVSSKNEGFITASKVQYNAISADFFADGFVYSGALKVASAILDDFLYEEVRVKGGAYGVGSSFGQNGGAYFYSYRDPHVENTFAAFRSSADYLRNLDLSQAEMDKFIIGTIRNFDRPLTNANKGIRAITRHLVGITDEKRQRERNEILGATAADIRKLAGIVAASLAQDNLCAIGGEAAINQAAGTFGTTRRI